MSDPIVIVDYEPRWPAMFERERRRIQGALGSLAVAIEHIGSTAVPGLAAKPIIDILVGVRGSSDLDGCIGPLTAIGYIFDPFPEFPDRRFFRDGPVGGTDLTMFTARAMGATLGTIRCSSGIGSGLIQKRRAIISL